MSDKLASLPQYRWPVSEWAIARLSVRLDALAANNGLAIYDWVEDGLGPCSGCAFRLPSGVVVMLQELDHAISHFKTRGPDVYADAGDVEGMGRDSILLEMLQVLGLGGADVDLRLDPPGPGEVDRMREVVEGIRRRRIETAEAKMPSALLSEETRELRRRKARDAFAAVQQRLDDKTSSRVLKLIEEQEFGAALKLMCTAIESRDTRLSGDETLKLARLANALDVPFAIRRSARPNDRS